MRVVCGYVNMNLLLFLLYVHLYVVCTSCFVAQVRDAAYYKTKKELTKLKTKAAKNVAKSLDAIAAPLAALGHPLAL